MIYKRRKMIFDGHADILSDVMEQFKEGKDIWKDYHLPLYQQGKIKLTVLINYSDPFSDDQDKYFAEVNKVAITYFKSAQSVNILHENGFNEDKVNAIFGIEGLKPVKDMQQIQEMYNLGYRLFGLTWNEDNQFANGCRSIGGLTKLGVKLIEYANKSNIIIDLAHSSKQTFLDVAKIYKKPLLVSHSGVRSIFDVARNLDDEQLEMIKQSNGVVGIFNIGKFLSNNIENVTVKTYVDHIDYVVRKIGIEHVGLGLDFCYYLEDHNANSNTKGLERICDVENIFIELKNRNYSEDDIEKIKFSNMYRVVCESLAIKPCKIN